MTNIYAAEINNRVTPDILRKINMKKCIIITSFIFCAGLLINMKNIRNIYTTKNYVVQHYSPYEKIMNVEDLPYYINENNEEPPLKKILFWRSYWWVYPVDQNIFKQCRVSSCIATFSEKQYDHKELDAVVFTYPMVSKSLKRWPNTRYIFMHMECPMHTSSLEKYNGFFNWTMTYRLDSDVTMWYGFTYKRSIHLQVAVNQTNKHVGKKLVAWMVSNCRTSSQREKYVEKLKEYIPIDIFGKCGKFKCPKNNKKKDRPCKRMISVNYKFYLAFENSICQDYVTEKFWEALKYGPVPVVWGGADYMQLAPPNSYINIKDFNSTRALADYLLYLDQNDTAYNMYYMWHKQYEVVADIMPAWYLTWCNLCARLHSDHTPAVIDNLDQWYRNGTCIPNAYEKLYKTID